VIFEQLCQEFDLNLRDLSFLNFKDLDVPLERIGIYPAD
jgi:hypothetical protein